MTDAHAQLLLLTGWARNDTPDGRWTLLAPDGTGAHWMDATPEEAAALEAALVAWPAVARIWTGMMDSALGHRADCYALTRFPCTCAGAATPKQLEPAPH